VIEKIEAFGIFLEVAPGIVALIPGSETGSGGDLLRNFKPGQKLTATVLSIERGRRRMSLSLRSADEERDVEATRKFLKEQAKTAKGGGSFGTLGDLLKKKLQ
jgi:small subunit ribosomal protein S1